MIKANNSILQQNSNNFNLIRLLAALIVIYAHSYALSPILNQGESIARWTGVTHAGELSVVIFFFISGALVTKSLVQSSSISSYLIKRIFRIYPALIICCLFVTYIVTWNFGGITFSDLLKSNQTFRYFINNSIGIWNEHFIPGVFENHLDKSLNGSLWSITLELRLYLLLALLAAIGLMKTKLSRILVFSAFLIALAINAKLVPLIGNDLALYGTNSFPAFSAIFILGGLFYQLEKHIKLNYSIALIVFGLLMIMARHSEIYRFSIFAFTIFLCLWIATRQIIIQKMSIEHDYSYGIYLYGWPAQQIACSILMKHGVASPINITCIAILIAVALAAISWHFIEKPSMRLANHLSQKKWGNPSDSLKKLAQHISTSLLKLRGSIKK